MRENIVPADYARRESARTTWLQRTLRGAMLARLSRLRHGILTLKDGDEVKVKRDVIGHC